MSNIDTSPAAIRGLLAKNYLPADVVLAMIALAAEKEVMKERARIEVAQRERVAAKFSHRPSTKATEDFDLPTASDSVAPQPAAPSTRSEKLREAGFTPRDTRIECDECGIGVTAQMLPIHKCAAPSDAGAVPEQVPLEPDIAKIVHDNLWELYGQESLAAAPEAPQPAPIEPNYELVNKLIRLGAQAAHEHAKSNSDDGREGTRAHERWANLRLEMWALIVGITGAQGGGNG